MGGRTGILVAFLIATSLNGFHNFLGVEPQLEA